MGLLSPGITTPQANRQEQSSRGDDKALPDIRQFLRPAGIMETRYVRLLSSLCAQTYVMHKLTVSLHQRDFASLWSL